MGGTRLCAPALGLCGLSRPDAGEEAALFPAMEDRGLLPHGYYVAFDRAGAALLAQAQAQALA